MEGIGRGMGEKGEGNAHEDRGEIRVEQHNYKRENIAIE